MKYKDLISDDAALAELGSRLAQTRIDLNITQAELAKQAGVGKRTLERLESGESTQTQTLIRVLRGLDLLAKLEGLVPEVSTRPRFQVKGDARRRRASKKVNEGGAQPWTWGDER